MPATDWGAMEAAASQRWGAAATLVAYGVGAARPVSVLYRRSSPTSDDLLADLVAARAAGTQASVAVATGHGGRSAIGRVLTRWAATRLFLRAQGHEELADWITADWLDPDPDPPIRRWAASLGIAVGETPAPPTSMAHRAGASGQWHLRRGEDPLLHAYWLRHGGKLWREVPIGAGGKQRRIDGVLVPGGPCVEETGPVTWTEPNLQVIEVKQVLDQTAIGQAAAGVSAARELGAVDVGAVVLVSSINPSESALVDVCAELGLRLDDHTERSTVLTLAVSHDDPLLAQLDQLRAARSLGSRSEVLLELAREAIAAALRPET